MKETYGSLIVLPHGLQSTYMIFTNSSQVTLSFDFQFEWKIIVEKNGNVRQSMSVFPQSTPECKYF